MMTLVDEDFDDEWIDDQDEGDDELICPACHRGVHEDAQQCHHCGEWIIPVYPTSSWKFVWIVAAGLVIAGMILMVIT